MERGIFKRYLNGEASPAERVAVEKWLETPEGIEEMDAMMAESWEASEDVIPAENLEKVLAGVHRQIGVTSSNKLSPNDKKSKYWTTLKMAASFLLIGLLGFLVYQQLNGPKTAPAETARVFTKEALAGQKLKLRLPDQTFVILNANSTISYSSDFGREERRVSLEGEAFFEVAHDPSRPFVVHTQNVETTALGTAFNAYSRNGDVKVALTEGKVQVVAADEGLDQSVLLDPGQMAVSSDSAASELNVVAFVPSEVTVWKEGRIRFRSEPLEEVFAQLESWYGVEIHVSGKWDRRRKVSGVFNNENLENILKGLTFSLGRTYQIEGNKVTIKK